MKAKDFIKRIEHVFPKEWALDGDPIGFLIGDPEQNISKAFIALEITSDVMKQAKQKKADFLLVHHPLLFRPLKKILETDPVSRFTREIIKNDMCLYAAHTNVDLHPQGMAKTWLEIMGATSAEPLAKKPQAGQLKIVTFVPAASVNKVRTALSTAGAGNIGEYDLCSFNLEGMGTFRGSEYSNPFVGNSGKFEQEPETRLEMVLPVSRKQAVVNALWNTHPYEEPAYDLFPMEDVKSLDQALWVAEFQEPITWENLLTRIKKSVPKDAVLDGTRFVPRKKIRRIALSTGSGSSFIPRVCTLGVDAYITGEVGYHLLWEAKENGLPVVTVGHDSSELFFAETVNLLLLSHVGDVRLINEKVQYT